MSKLSPKVVVRDALRWVGEHPRAALHSVGGLGRLRIGLPLDVLRYLVQSLWQGKQAPTDVRIEASPPGLRFEGSLRLAGTTLRVSAIASVDDVQIEAASARLTLRIGALEVRVLEGKDTPLGSLLRSGYVDLRKPASLLGYLPRKPAALLEADQDRFVIDLWKLPQLARAAGARRVTLVLAQVLGVAAIQTEQDRVDVHLRLQPKGIGAAIAHARSAR